MEKAIELTSLTKVFGQKQAVQNLSLEVERGSIFGFLGPNGAGKTTTIKMMLGLLRPDGGSGRVLGLDMVKDSVTIRQHVGYVAEVQQMYGYMTVLETLDFCRAFYRNWNGALVDRYLGFFNLPHREKIKNLSKGMKTQLALVAAMAHEPELLVLDEPTAGLDPVSRHEFLRIILEEVAVEGRTVFFSSHFLHDVERIADRIAMIKDGKLIDIRPMDELKTTVKKIRAVFQREPDDSLFEIPGVQSVSRQGNAYLISVDDNLAEILRRLHEQPHYTLDVIDQNLEEIFIEKVKGELK